MHNLKLFGRTDGSPSPTRRLQLTDQYWQRLGELADAKQLDRSAYVEHYVNDLEQAKEELKSIVAGMQGLAHQDQDYITDLTNQADRFQDEIDRLQDEIDQLQKDNACLQQQVQEVNAKRATLEQQNEQLKGEQTAVQNPVQAPDIARPAPQQVQPIEAEPVQNHAFEQVTLIPKAGTPLTVILQRSIIALVSLAILFLVGGYTIPSAVHVERSLHINAKPATIFPLVGDLAQWSKWSPWAELDPNMEMTLRGSGKGQVLQWHSTNPSVGAGTQELTTIEPPNYVQSHLDFGDRGGADATILLTAEDDGTLVSWVLDADMRAGVPTLKQPLSTYFGFFMDSLIGPDYETGLSNLKTLVEQASKKPFFQWSPRWSDQATLEKLQRSFETDLPRAAAHRNP
ncbi:MAG: SRPBCC family protein [Thermosynechococcaceae cyanobacterium]